MQLQLDGHWRTLLKSMFDRVKEYAGVMDGVPLRISVRYGSRS